MNILNKIFSLSLIFLLASCSSLTPYKVPILQGNIFDEEDVEKWVTVTDDFCAQVLSRDPRALTDLEIAAMPPI